MRITHTLLRNRPVHLCIDPGKNLWTLRARILGVRGRVLAVTAPFDLSLGKIRWPEPGREVLIDLRGTAPERPGRGASLPPSRFSSVAPARVLERRLQPLPVLLLEVASDVPVAAAGLGRNWGRIVVVTGGKGGTGKSITAVNLAFSAASEGIRTVLVDADFRTGDVAVLTGVRPAAGIGDILQARVPLDQALVPWHSNAYVLASPVEREPVADPSPWELARVAGLLDALAQRFDLVIVDTAAGVGSSITNLLLLADHIYVVTLNEPTALLDAYRLVKAAVLAGVRRPYQLLINRVEDHAEAEAAGRRFAQTAAQHLRVRVELAGLVPEDAAVRWAVVGRESLLAAGHSTAGAVLKAVATNLFRTAAMWERHPLGDQGAQRDYAGS